METKVVEKRESTGMTWLLVIACIVAYPAGMHSDHWACSYNSIFSEGRWWTAFTALFVHGGIGHLLGNLLFLFLFGRGLERYIGSARLLVVFVAGGAISMFLSTLYYPPYVPCVGASGAISAILATLMLFNPWRLSLLLNFFPMPLGVAGCTYIAMNIGGFYSDLVHPAASSHIAYIGHLLGFVAGIFFGAALSPDWKKNIVVSLLQFICFYALVFLAIWYFTGR